MSSICFQHRTGRSGTKRYVALADNHGDAERVGAPTMILGCAIERAEHAAQRSARPAAVLDLWTNERLAVAPRAPEPPTAIPF